MTKIARLSALERALDYPYDAPDHAYLIKDDNIKNEIEIITEKAEGNKCPSFIL